MGYPIYHSAYTAAQIEAAIGKGPRVNASGYWEVWNVANMAYESTGVGAGVTPPTVVTQVSQMTNHGYVYIYNGNETGYTPGYWYYWDGSAWTAGGAYQVAATDPTLSVAGAAADAEVTGKVISNATGNMLLTNLGSGKYIQIAGSGTISLTPLSSENYKSYSVTPCVAGDRFTYSGRTNTATSGWAFVDSNNQLLAKCDTNKTFVEDVCVAPAGAAYFITNSMDDMASYYGELVKTVIDRTTDRTKNLWRYGDVDLDSSTPVKVFYNCNLPAGTYTLSAEVTSSSPTSSVRMVFYPMVYGGTSVSTGAIIPDGVRRSVTFTLTSTYQYVRVRNALSEGGSSTVHWHNIQIEAGAVATPYEGEKTAVDYEAREVVSPDNLWTYGDVEFLKTQTYPISLTAGEYTFAAYADIVGEDYMPSLMRVAFCVGTTEKQTTTVSPFMDSANRVVLESAVDNIKLYSSNTAGNAAGHTSRWTRVQLLKSNRSAPYYPYALPVKDVYKYANTDPDLIGLVENYTQTASSRIFSFVRKTDDLRPIVIDCKAKWTGSETDEYHVPEIRFYYKDDGYNTSGRLNIGQKDIPIHQQWRIPPIQDFPGADGNRVSVQVWVPSGLTLTIERMQIRYGDVINRSESGLRIDTHLDFWGYPSLSVHALRAAEKCSASHCIVIPKVSSDGVWFAYHDDTFDESTTILRNADGTVISGSEYNGLKFNQIPWTWLSTLDSGVYKGAWFTGTRLMTISEMLESCNRTGVHPVFSWHPTSSLAETQSFYNLLKTYNMVGKATILPEVEWFTNVCYPVFGNELETYKFGLGLGNTSPENLAALIARINGTAGLDKSKVCIALWINEATAELVQTIRDAGMTAGIHANGHTTMSGVSAGATSAGDYKYWQSAGATVFTDGRMSSMGLDW